MGVFSNNAITDVGRMMLADVQAGAVFTPTRIVIGSGTMPGGATTQSMTNVITPVKSLAINRKKRTPDGKCIFGGVYTNEEVTAPFYFRELALYAKAVYLNPDGSVLSEGEETLYSYGNAGATADYMPAYSTSTVVEKQIDLVTWVGNEAQVDLTIESGIYVSPSEFKAHASRHAADGEDPITPESIGAAHHSLVENVYDVNSNEMILAILEEEVQNMRDNSVRHICTNDYVGGTIFMGGETHLTIYKVTSSYACVEAIKYHSTGVYKWRCSKYITWQTWEWENPSFDSGFEYRTTERYHGYPVIKKMDASGNILWRAEHESSWRLLTSASAVVQATLE